MAVAGLSSAPAAYHVPNHLFYSEVHLNSDAIFRSRRVILQPQESFVCNLALQEIWEPGPANLQAWENPKWCQAGLVLGELSTSVSSVVALSAVERLL